jgi:PrtD family type I secretion system ABC transporter
VREIHIMLADLKSCRAAFAGVAAMSGLSNILMLTGSFFMLQVYDRVLPSRSVPTLVALAVLAGGLFCFQGLLDLIRSRILVRIGQSLDETLGPAVHDRLLRLPLAAGKAGEGLQPLRDLDGVRAFLSGAGPVALFDLPWIPLYLGLCFVFHVWIGVAALAGVIVLVGLTLATELLTRAPQAEAARLAQQRLGLAELGRRNAEIVAALGMAGRFGTRWQAANHLYLAGQRRLADVTGSFSATSRVLRMALQSAVLAVGAWLVIHGEATAGIIIASSILSARALAPVDQAIAHWKGFGTARQGYARLRKLMAMLPGTPEPLALPAPVATLAVEAASVAPPGSDRIAVIEASFSLAAGQALGVIGPSASGKSSLARLLVGVWRPAGGPRGGKVRLDGAALDQWSATSLGRHIGYLPQDVELMAGTVAENIARFDPEATADRIVAAARAAGVHELIVGLPAGYETEVGEQGHALSAGQQQRVALARALFGEPFLVVLDEPNSNLDGEGEAALTKAIEGVRARGGIAVVIAHRPSALAACDRMLVMDRGRVQAFGPKEQVMASAMRRAAPLSVVGGPALQGAAS